MKKSMLFLLVGALLLVGATGCADLRKVTMRDVQRMELEELKSRLNDPAFVVIDVRIADDWEGSPRKVAGARRELADNVSTWQSKYDKDKTIVLYCASPTEATSARVAQQMMASGFHKVYALKGGWKAWEAGGYPTEPKGK